jgi:hypothetical protein
MRFWENSEGSFPQADPCRQSTQFSVGVTAVSTMLSADCTAEKPKTIPTETHSLAYILEGDLISNEKHHQVVSSP